jgi:hypothetical protein
MHVTLDPTTARQLQGLGQVVDLRDPSGRLLGRFVPATDLAEWEPASPEVSEEELNRRAQSAEKRFTTAEVLAHLEKL